MPETAVEQSSSSSRCARIANAACSVPAMTPDHPAHETDCQLLTRLRAEAMDERDPLAGCREWFALPRGLIYMDGNSLGALPTGTAPRVAGVVADWGHDLVGSWNRHDWIGWPRRAGDRIARL